MGLSLYLEESGFFVLSRRSVAFRFVPGVDREGQWELCGLWASASGRSLVFVVFLDVECFHFRYLLMEECSFVKTIVEGIMAYCCADGTYYVQNGEIRSVVRAGGEECPLILEPSGSNLNVWQLLFFVGLGVAMLLMIWKCYARCCKEKKPAVVNEEVEEDVV